MTVNLQVSDRVARQLQSLEPESIDDIDRKLTRLLEAELRRRLARYDLTDRQLSQKYGMSYAEFES